MGLLDRETVKIQLENAKKGKLIIGQFKSPEVEYFNHVFIDLCETCLAAMAEVERLSEAQGVEDPNLGQCGNFICTGEKTDCTYEPCLERAKREKKNA